MTTKLRYKTTYQNGKIAWSDKCPSFAHDIKTVEQCTTTVDAYAPTGHKIRFDDILIYGG